jgi:hypothetical protein
VVAPNIHGLSVRILLHITLQAPTILRWFLEFWKICKPLAIAHAIDVYSVLAVAIYVFIKTCPYSVHTHILTGASVQFLFQIFVQVCLCTLFCRCAVASSTGGYRNLQISTGNCFGEAGLGLDPYGPVQSNPVWHSHFDTGYANLKQPYI